MIIVNSTVRTLQVVLAGAITTNQLDCTSHYQDYRLDGDEDSFGTTVVNTNNTTAVTLVPSPTSGVARATFSITVFNKDTVAATVTVRFNDNGTTYVIFKGELASEDTLIYSAEDGWFVFDVNGNRKTN